jgi:hypothetical protein
LPIRIPELIHKWSKSACYNKNVEEKYYYNFKKYIMKNTIVWIVLIIVVIAGIAWLTNRPTVEAPVSQNETAAPEPTVIVLNEQNSSGMSGTATFTEMNGSTLVKINLAGAPATGAQPAHIHTGSCANIGGIAYPITSLVNGTSETTINESLGAIMAKLPLALNVHKSAEEISVYMACGDLK